MNQGSLLGRQLDEYRLETLLGQGGMARVYRGIDVRLKRYVAIKVIMGPHQTDESYKFRFEREAQALAQLDHPHVIRLYRYGEVEGLLYMAMQYIEGADLGFVLQTYQNDDEFMEFPEIERIIGEVCQALDYVHSQGVIHRDIKPANILLDKNGKAIISDFGLVLVEHMGTRGEIFGSPHYIAPEQAISSAGAVPQSDLYSIGVTLYEMFTGQLPFNAPDPMDVALMQMSEEPVPPRELRPTLNPHIEAVILKAMAKEPEERYQTGSDLVEALGKALWVEDKPTTASRLTIMERVDLELNQNPLPPLPAAITPSPPPTPIQTPVRTTEAMPPSSMPSVIHTTDAPQMKSMLDSITDWLKRMPLILGGGVVLAICLAVTIMAFIVGTLNKNSSEVPIVNIVVTNTKVVATEMPANPNLDTISPSGTPTLTLLPNPTTTPEPNVMETPPLVSTLTEPVLTISPNTPPELMPATPVPNSVYFPIMIRSK